MRKRKTEHENKIKEFIFSEGEELKKKILEEANREFKKIDN